MDGGIVRDMDPLGRVVLPIELRGRLGIKSGDSLEIFVDKDCIIFKKYAPGCVFCGEVEGTTTFKGKPVCEHCLESIQALTGSRASTVEIEIGGPDVRADEPAGLSSADEPCSCEPCSEESCSDEPCGCETCGDEPGEDKTGK